MIEFDEKLQIELILSTDAIKIIYKSYSKSLSESLCFFWMFNDFAYFLKNPLLIFFYLLTLELEAVCQDPGFPSLPEWILEFLPP